MLIKPLKIGGITLRNNLVLAPMAGYGDASFRHLAIEAGAGLTVGEMVSVLGIRFGNENTAELLKKATNESPSCVQLFGKNPDDFKSALQNELVQGFDIIDVNMGCPVPKVFKQGAGAALMEQPQTAEKIVGALMAAGKPITVKMRLGINSVVAVDFAKRMEAAGASAISVHGRTARQMYSGAADVESVNAVSAAVKIPVVANGDITDLPSLERYCAAGFMIGRGAIGNLGIFAQLLGKKALSRREYMFRQLELSEWYYGADYTYRAFRKHFAFYIKGTRGASALKVAVNTAQSLEHLRQILFSIKEMV